MSLNEPASFQFSPIVKSDILVMTTIFFMIVRHPVGGWLTHLAHSAANSECWSLPIQELSPRSIVQFATKSIYNLENRLWHWQSFVIRMDN